MPYRWNNNEFIAQELDVFNGALRTAGRATAIPKEAYDGLWTLAILLANRTFVEGFAGAKKCTNEGRALMQLDYQQFIMKAEKLTSLRLVVYHLSQKNGGWYSIS